MDWTNLVLSCMHCNQLRKHKEMNPDWSEDEIRRALLDGRVKTIGKKNFFPTLNAFWETDPEKNINETEKPALINPADTDPEGMFLWIYKPNLVCTLKGVDPDGRAQITINILGINRRYLTEARMKCQASLYEFAMKLRIFYDDMRAAATPEAKALTQKYLKMELESLKKFAHEMHPFSAMRKDFYKRQKSIFNDALTND